jgi:hypothetical protein
MSRRVNCASSRDNKGFLLDQEGLSSSREGCCCDRVRASPGLAQGEALRSLESQHVENAELRASPKGREGDVSIQLPRAVHAVETNMLEDIILGPIGEG